MSLTHVSIWDKNIGYKHIELEDAISLYPDTVSANSSIFVCELCADNVTLTGPSKSVERHFRHEAGNPNDCEEREQYYANYKNSYLKGFNSHFLPFRIVQRENTFYFQLGFFALPKSRNLKFDKLEIITKNRQKICTYSSERINKTGTTFFDVGKYPFSKYYINYINADKDINKYWPTITEAFDNENGSFFDFETGNIIRKYGNIYTGKSYYFITPRKLNTIHDCTCNLVSSIGISKFQLNIYKIDINNFSRKAATFFLKFKIYLREKASEYYPLWPNFIESQYFIYHNSPYMYFFMKNLNTSLELYPKIEINDRQEINNNQLIKIPTRDLEQLISMGTSGSLGFSYLIKSNLDSISKASTILIKDLDDNILQNNQYDFLPKGNTIIIKSEFDGIVQIKKEDEILNTKPLKGEQELYIDTLSLGQNIYIYQGLDLIKQINFAKLETRNNSGKEDLFLVEKLRNLKGGHITLPHSSKTILLKFNNFPRTKKWIYSAFRKGRISEKAFKLLITYKIGGEK